MKRLLIACLVLTGLSIYFSNANTAHAQITTLGATVATGRVYLNDQSDACSQSYTNVPNILQNATYRFTYSGVADFNADYDPPIHIYRDAMWQDESGVCESCFIKRAHITTNGKYPSAYDTGTSYNPTHTYHVDWKADSDDLVLTMGDSNFCDNEGYISFSMQLIALPSYSITGSVYNDTNKNGTKDVGELTITSPITITTSKGTVVTNQGNFTISNVSAGNTTVSYTSLPTDYSITYPLNGPPPSFQVAPGPTCNTNGARGATCVNGSVTNLNFAISNSNAWMQAYGLDVRFDDGYTNLIPNAPTYPHYGSAQGATSNTPGIIYAGDASPDFGQGQASTTNWVVGGSQYPEVYSSASPLSTSYTSLLNKIARAEITPTNITTLSGCTNLTNCTLPANLPNGIYHANGNLTLNAFTVPANRSYIILVNGDVSLRGNITTPTTATIFIAASRDINIPATVGAATNSAPLPTPQLQGIFSADRYVTILGNNNCSVGADRMLNMAGALIANAALGGGGIRNQRDLCGANATVPSFTMSERLDFLLNAPTILSQQSTTIQEQAP